MQLKKLVIPKRKEMRTRTCLAAGGSLLVATIGLFSAQLLPAPTAPHR